MPGLVQQKVILVGLDRVVPACRISVGLEPLEAERTIVDVLRKDGVPIRECIQRISDRLHIVSSIIDLAPMEMVLLSRASREKILDRALKPVRGGVRLYPHRLPAAAAGQHPGAPGADQPGAEGPGRDRDAVRYQGVR